MSIGKTIKRAIGGTIPPPAPRRRIKGMFRVNFVPLTPLFAARPSRPWAIPATERTVEGHFTGPDGSTVKRFGIDEPARNGAYGFIKERAAASSPEAMVARLKKLGVGLEVTPGGRLILHGERSLAPPLVIEQVRPFAPLLAAHLSGKPLACEVTADCTEAAVTILAIDCPACPTHAAERVG